MYKPFLMLLCSAWAWGLAPQAWAEPGVVSVWHCTRNAVELNQGPTEDFGLGAVTSEHDTIRVGLQDLIAVYSGYPLRVSGRPLFACFMPGNEALSLAALDSLGLNASALQILARRSAIVQRQLEIVTNEAQMQRCMERNAPAFGYLPSALINEKVAPCF